MSARDEHRGADVARLATSAGGAVVGRGLGRAMQLATTLLLARVAGPTALGVFAVAWTVVRYLALVGTLGLEQGAIRHGAAQRSDPPAHRAVLRDALWIATAVGLFLGVAVWASSDRLGAAAGGPMVAGVLRLLAPSLPLMTSLVVLSAAMRVGSTGLRSTLAEDVVQPALALALTAAAFVVMPDERSAAVAVVISFAGALLVASVGARADLVHLRGVTPARRVTPRELLAFSVSSALPSRLGWLIVWADRVVVGALLGAREAGLYQAAAQLTMVFPLLLSGIAAAATPMLADLGSGDAVRRRRTVYVTSTRWCMLFSLPALVGGLVMPEALLQVVFGGEFVGGAAALRMLFLGQLVNAATGVVSVVLAMSGRQRGWVAVTAVVVIADLVGCVVLVPRLGAIGAALATGLATSVLNGAGVLLARRTGIGLPWDASTGRVAAAYALAFTVAVVADRVVLGSASRLIVATLGGVVVAAGALALAARDPRSEEAVLLARLRRPGRAR